MFIDFAIALEINSFALVTAFVSSLPFANSVVIAAEYTHPVPCTSLSGIKSCSKISNDFPSYKTSLATFFDPLFARPDDELMPKCPTFYKNVS